MNKYVVEEGLLNIIPNINEQFENCLLIFKMLNYHNAHLKKYSWQINSNEIKYCYDIYVETNSFHIFSLYFYSNTKNIFVNFTANTKNLKSHIWKGPIQIETGEQLEQILNKIILEN